MVASSGTPAERRNAFGLAFEQLEAAEAVWPVASSARRLGVLHRDLGDVAPDAESRALSWAEAMRWLDVALERDPHGIESLVERGRVLERLGRLDEAAADHARAASLDPGRADAWAGYARALLATGDLPGGVAATDEALTHLAPDRVLAAASAPLPAPWVRELGSPLDAMARGALLVIARTRVEGLEEGKAARAQLDELDASSTLAMGLRDWLDAGAPAFAPASPSSDGAATDAEPAPSGDAARDDAAPAVPAQNDDAQDNTAPRDGG
jgi:tetratricopeptide (TPR) repeat protein